MPDFYRLGAIYFTFYDQMQSKPQEYADLRRTGLSPSKIVRLRKAFGEYQRGMNRIIWTEDPDVRGQNLKAYQSGWLRKFKKGEACYRHPLHPHLEYNCVQGEGGFVGFFIYEDNEK